MYSKKKQNLPPKGPSGLFILVAIVGICIGFLLWFNSADRTIEPVSYSTLMSQIADGKVKSLKVQDQAVYGTYKESKKPFNATIAPTDTFWNFLLAHNVDVEIIPSDKQSWGAYLLISFLPFILILLFFYFRQSQPGSGGSKIFSVGKSKARFFSPDTVKVKFKDVAGVHEAKDDLKDVVDFLKNPERFNRLGAKIPRGVLLSGAPGNGKTLLAKAVAGEAHCPFFSISGSDFVEVFVGVGASRVRDLFSQARKNAPCIVFIDEIDAVGRQRGVGLGGGNDEREQTLNQLLTEMDGFSTEAGTVIVIAATNRQDVLDKALLRPGRFDRIIEVPYPDISSREEILKVHARHVKLASEVDLHKIARGTPGFSGADLANLINEAALISSKKHHENVSIEAFEQARDKVILGSERKTMIFTEKEKEMTAYHEAGHTLLNLLLPETDPFHKVTIIPRGRALGVSWSLPERDKYSQTKTEMTSRIIVCFGGLLGERLIFNEQTSGVSNDLEQATNIARAMVKQFGMSDLGPIDFKEDPHAYPGTKVYSERTNERIDQEVEKIMKESYEKGQQLLLDNMDKLKTLAAQLLEKETLLAEEVYELLDITPRQTHGF